LSFDLAIAPAANVSWADDVFGNALATATFANPTDTLLIESVAEVDLAASAWPVFNIAASAISYPFRYSDQERTDLGGLTLPMSLDGDGQVRRWAHSYVAGNPTDTLSLLKDLSAGVAATLVYEPREDQGTQSPKETLERGYGSCRDFAVLFVEAARSLGFGARIISGYLLKPVDDSSAPRERGSTHAWAEIYLPGAGWITFDPTNRAMGSSNLVPVAVARGIESAMPVAGSYSGEADLLEEMSVEVAVTAQHDPKSIAEEGLERRPSALERK
jgi:transglutaminase-like putative cysteine protease